MIIKGIRIFILDKIVPEYQGIRAHPDSTTGLGTLVYTDDRETPLLTDTRHGKLKYYLAIFIAYYLVQQILIMRESVYLKIIKASIFAKILIRYLAEMWRNQHTSPSNQIL